MNTITDVIEYNVTNAKLNELHDKYTTFDATTKAGYKSVTAGLSELRSLRISVEKRRKELKKDALDYGRRVDTEAKRITSKLVKIEQPMKDAKAEVDNEKKRLEEQRIKLIKEKMTAFAITNMRIASDMPENELSAYYESIESKIIDSSFEEFEQQATVEKEYLLSQLKRIIDQNQAEKRIAEEQARIAEEQRKIAAEHARLKSLEAERLRKEREQEIKQQAEQEAKARFEREAKEQAERVAKAKADEQYQIERQRKEAERQEALRPEKEKLTAYATEVVDDFIQQSKKHASTNDGKIVLHEFLEKINSARSVLLNQINSL